MIPYTNFLSIKKGYTLWEMAEDFATVIPVVGIITGGKKLYNVMNADNPDLLGSAVVTISGIMEITGIGIVARAVDLLFKGIGIHVG